MNVVPGKRLRVMRGYSARAFGLRDGERIACAYGEFSREGREPALVSLASGQELVALTSDADGMTYGEAELGGRPYAVLLLPGSYQG